MASKKGKVQNGEARIENQTLIDVTKNEVVSEATLEIFGQVLGLDNMKNLSENIAAEISEELTHKSFMTEQLELTDRQKELLLGSISQIVEKAKNRYLFDIKKDERTKDIAVIVQDKCVLILEEMLSSLASEVNRGALINCVAVAADTKNEDYNKIELRALKSAGDITMPTRCLLVSTNCYDIIRHSIEETLQPVIKELSSNGISKHN